MMTRMYSFSSAHRIFYFAEPRPVRYADLGGIDAVRQDIQELIENPLRHPEVIHCTHHAFRQSAPWASGAVLCCCWSHSV